MASASAPDGGTPPPADLGARFSQKREWFKWPLKRDISYRIYLFLFALYISVKNTLRGTLAQAGAQFVL